MRRISRAFAAFAIVAGLSIPALAGGSVWHFGNEYRPGEIAESTTPVAWDHKGSLGRPEHGPYLLYLAPGDATAPVWPGFPEDAMLVGIVDIELGPYVAEDGASYGPHHAVASFEIPAIPPGTYQVFHCNEPCTKTLGDIIGGWDLQVVEGPDGRAPETIAGEVREALAVYPPWPETSAEAPPSVVLGANESITEVAVPPQAFAKRPEALVVEPDPLAAPEQIELPQARPATAHPALVVLIAGVGIVLVALISVPLVDAVVSWAKRRSPHSDVP